MFFFIGVLSVLLFISIFNDISFDVIVSCFVLGSSRVVSSDPAPDAAYFFYYSELKLAHSSNPNSAVLCSFVYYFKFFI